MAMLGLNDITIDGDGPVDRELRNWREGIERANGFVAFGACTFDEGPGGAMLFVPDQITSARHAVVLSPGISAASGADSLGSGPIMLRKRVGTAITNDRQATLYINFTVPIPTGTRITVVPDGDDWTIPGANCP